MCCQIKRDHPGMRNAAWAAVVLLAGVSLSACSFVHPGFLNAAGPVAAAQRELLVQVVLLMLVVIIPVLVLTPLFAWRYRYKNRDAAYTPAWDFSRPIEFLIWGVPVVIVVAMGVLVWRATHALDPYKPVSSSQGALEVQVVGLDWKWLFIYPEQNIATVNELVFPAGRPLRIALTSDSVLQSFMIPQLGGQIYAMAGMRTELNLKSDASGTFLGQNTQFNGKGFQNQKFRAVAVPAEEFPAWVAKARVQAAGAMLDSPGYARLALQSVPGAPLFYSKVQPGLFEEIMGRYDHAAASGHPSAGHE